MVCSNFWKLDKIDKIVISLIFVFFTMFSIFDCFCFASSSVDYDYIENLGGNWNEKIFQSSPGRNGICFSVQPGHTYRILITNVGVYSWNYSYSTEYPAPGVKVLQSFASTGAMGLDYEFTVPNDVNYVYFYGYNNGFQLTDESTVSIQDITRLGFASAIDNLFLNVGVAQLWSVFETSIPWVLVVVLFVFGWWFFAHWVKELSKGREF